MKKEALLLLENKEKIGTKLEDAGKGHTPRRGKEGN